MMQAHLLYSVSVLHAPVTLRKEQQEQAETTGEQTADGNGALNTSSSGECKPYFLSSAERCFVLVFICDSNGAKKKERPLAWWVEGTVH